MTLTNRILGVALTALGVGGVIVCVAAAVTVWNVRNRLDHAAAIAFERVDETFARLEDRSQQTNQRIHDIQESLQRLNDRVQQRVAEVRDTPESEAPDIDQIERQLRVRIQRAKSWIGFTQTTVDLVQQLLDMMQSTSVFVEQDSRTTRELVTSLRTAHEEVDVASGLIDDVQRRLIDVRAKRNLDENAKQINTLASRIDRSLKKVAGYGKQFEAGVVKSRSDVTTLGADIRWRLSVIAMICSGLLLWMAIGQVSLVFDGLRRIRQQRQVESHA